MNDKHWLQKLIWNLMFKRHIWSKFLKYFSISYNAARRYSLIKSLYPACFPFKLYIRCVYFNFFLKHFSKFYFQHKIICKAKSHIFTNSSPLFRSRPQAPSMENPLDRHRTRDVLLLGTTLESPASPQDPVSPCLRERESLVGLNLKPLVG